MVESLESTSAFSAVATTAANLSPCSAFLRTAPRVSLSLDSAFSAAAMTTFRSSAFSALSRTALRVLSSFAPTDWADSVTSTTSANGSFPSESLSTRFLRNDTDSSSSPGARLPDFRCLSSSSCLSLNIVAALSVTSTNVSTCSS